MAENIISDTEKSNRINKRLREDRTLIKEAENFEFFFFFDRNMDVKLRRTDNFTLDISFFIISIYSLECICLDINDLQII